jgi:DNA uptake protein ComE-like DNA-binding protein
MKSINTQWKRLNEASEEELARVPEIGAALAHRIVQQRPFANWGELEAVAGFEEGTIEKLRQNGYTL